MKNISIKHSVKYFIYQIQRFLFDSKYVAMIFVNVLHELSFSPSPLIIISANKIIRCNWDAILNLSCQTVI